jgi:hypothetical protein
MSFYDTMRDAYSSAQPRTCNDESTLKRHMPATTDTRSANTTGDRIDGQFVMMHTKNGQKVFVGIDGQFIRTY